MGLLFADLLLVCCFFANYSIFVFIFSPSGRSGLLLWPDFKLARSAMEEDASPLRGLLFTGHCRNVLHHVAARLYRANHISAAPLASSSELLSTPASSTAVDDSAGLLCTRHNEPAAPPPFLRAHVPKVSPLKNVEALEHHRSYFYKLVVCLFGDRVVI